MKKLTLNIILQLEKEEAEEADKKQREDAALQKKRDLAANRRKKTEARIKADQEQKERLTKKPQPTHKELLAKQEEDRLAKILETKRQKQRIKDEAGSAQNVASPLDTLPLELEGLEASLGLTPARPATESTPADDPLDEPLDKVLTWGGRGHGYVSPTRADKA